MSDTFLSSAKPNACSIDGLSASAKTLDGARVSSESRTHRRIEHAPNRRRITSILTRRAMLTMFSSAVLTEPARAARWPCEWSDGTFIYHADFQVPRAQQIVQQVRQLKSDIPQQLGLVASNEPVHVYLFHDRNTYEGYLKKYFPSVPFRQALFIKQHGAGMVFAFHNGDFITDLRHETTHAILHTLLPMVPLWLDEGLAEYFEVERDERAGKNPHLDDVHRALRWRRVPRIETLEQINDISRMDNRAYQEAWAWVHFLLHGPLELRHEFRSYLVDIQRQTPPGSLSDRLESRNRNVLTGFREHFRRVV